MKKLSIEKKTIVLHKNMNKKDLYLDSKKADSCKKNILKQLDIIQKSFDELDSILNKMSMKKTFIDEYNGFSLQCAKKCVSQAQAARSLMMNLESKYNDDQKSILIRELDERISYIEKKLANIE